MLRVEPERFDETLLELGQEMQRTAEERDVAADRPPLREVADGLVHDRLENRECNIRLCRAVVHERLDIRLGKDAAARRNRINLLSLGREVVEPFRVRREQ